LLVVIVLRITFFIRILRACFAGSNQEEDGGNRTKRILQYMLVGPTNDFAADRQIDPTFIINYWVAGVF
jgi:hypothetical protein